MKLDKEAQIELAKQWLIRTIVFVTQHDEPLLLQRDFANFLKREELTLSKKDLERLKNDLQGIS